MHLVCGKLVYCQQTFVVAVVGCKYSDGRRRRRRRRKEREREEAEEEQRRGVVVKGLFSKKGGQNEGLERGM